MKQETLAVVYARALLEVAQESGELEVVRDEVLALRETLDRERDVRVFIESPRIGHDEKRAACERALRGKLSDAMVNFLLLVIEKGREIYFHDMLVSFTRLYDKFVGIVRAKLTTAYELAESNAEEFRSHLEGALGRTVELERRVDEEVLGGFVVRFDGLIADASLRTMLDGMKDRMLNVKFGSELIHENKP